MSVPAASKEAELVTAVLLYAIRCLEEGDQPALRAMNFGPREIAALRELTLADLARAGALHVHCLDIELNRDVYWPMLEHLKRERRLEEVQRDLIEADAPLEMMRRLFGVGGREYTRLRRTLTHDPAVGRPPEPDEAVTHALWRAWSALRAARPDGVLSPEDYLALSTDTDASLRAVWGLTERWLACGEIAPVAAAANPRQEARKRASG